MKKIIFTGGGSSGHVTPNLALIEKFQKQGWHVFYVGSESGIEQELIRKVNIPYYAIKTGKLRRYFSWQNFSDPLKILFGVIQAYLIIRKMRPHVLFSKGGFVAFPVVVGAWLNRVPVIIHESDISPGLANRLSFPFAKKICVSFAESKKLIKGKDKILVTGTPIRDGFFSGDPEKGITLCGFDKTKKIILILGGGLGSQKINQIIRNALPQLNKDFQVAHICGSGKKDSQLEQVHGYKQFEYLHEDLFHVMACADIVISRAGANALYELVTLKKLHILIPLSKNASRGDQILNAEYFAKLGMSKVIREEDLTEETLLDAVIEIRSNEKYQHALEGYKSQNGTERVYNVLFDFATHKLS